MGSPSPERADTARNRLIRPLVRKNSGRPGNFSAVSTFHTVAGGAFTACVRLKVLIRLAYWCRATSLGCRR